MNEVRKALSLSDKFEAECESFRNANPGKLIRNDDTQEALRAFNAGAKGHGDGWPYPLGAGDATLLWFRQRGHVAASELDNG